MVVSVAASVGERIQDIAQHGAYFMLDCNLGMQSEWHAREEDTCKNKVLIHAQCKCSVVYSVVNMYILHLLGKSSPVLLHFGNLLFDVTLLVGSQSTLHIVWIQNYVLLHFSHMYTHMYVRQ